ncbi:MAG: site-specific DNA-methyltransferase [Eubacteriales bacterium]|nr:site-specific DNA-methyltransferase [Eubacteriales bacterium]
MEFRKLPIASLVPAAYNPRKDLQLGDPEFEKIRRSIEEFGYVEPIIVNEDMTIIGGHQRVKVLSVLGFTEIDCVIVSVDKTKEKALNIALNKITGEWDTASLAQLLAELDKQNYNLELTGFDWDEAEKLLKTIEKADDEKDDDFEPEPPEQPISRRGDVWLLGRHRLMCGDSTVAEDMAVLLEGKRVELVFTDPPWNVNYGATDHPSWKQRTIQNDSMSEEDFRQFLSKTFSRMADALVVGGMAYVVMSAQEWGSLMPALSENGFHWSSTIIWNKDRLVLSRKDYHTRYEPIWYGWKDGAPRIHPLTDRQQCDVWDIPRPSKSEEHPTMKPVELVERAIQNSSKRGNFVLDQFGGSGTTLIACENTGRTCVMMELDPKYADVIVHRFVEKAGDSEVFLLRDGQKTAYTTLQDSLDICSPQSDEWDAQGR